MLGASGGGIFNYQGELLGITTFKTPGRSAFYYSMPVEIIEEMLTKGEESFNYNCSGESFLGSA